VAPAAGHPAEAPEQSTPAETVAPKLNTRTEQSKHDRRERRHARYQEIVDLRQQGASILARICEEQLPDRTAHLRQWYPARPGGRDGRNIPAMEQRTGRRPGQPAQACEALDVWTSEVRLAQATSYGANLTPKGTLAHENCGRAPFS